MTTSVKAAGHNEPGTVARVLGQMASGIAHDIHNAISPVSLYTETMLEREAGLSDEAREYLRTIQRSVDDVSHTVERLRDFSRQRERHLKLTPLDLNALVEQVKDLTRARWHDMPRERGVAVEMHTDLTTHLPMVMGSRK